MISYTKCTKQVHDIQGSETLYLELFSPWEIRDSGLCLNGSSINNNMYVFETRNVLSFTPCYHV